MAELKRLEFANEWPNLYDKMRIYLHNRNKLNRRIPCFSFSNSLCIVYFTLVLICCLSQVSAQRESDLGSGLLGFKKDPTVRAECSEATMFIHVKTYSPFGGIVYARGYRDSCKAIGNERSKNVVLQVPMNNDASDANYCGPRRNPKTGQLMVAVEVRFHKILELDGDKTFLITCPTKGNRLVEQRAFKQSSKTLSMAIFRDGREVKEIRQGDSYTLRAEVDQPDPLHNVDVRECYAFGRDKSEVINLTDEMGCPEDDSKQFISEFKVKDGNVLEAEIPSMLKFSSTDKVNIVCNVAVCNGQCPTRVCGRTKRTDFRPTEEERTQVSTSVTASQLLSSNCEWADVLLGLAIAFGVLFLLMLIINIFLCAAMRCTCIKREIVEEEPTMPDYDPYKTAWTDNGSIAHDKYSMSGRPHMRNGTNSIPPTHFREPSRLSYVNDNAYYAPQSNHRY